MARDRQGDDDDGDAEDGDHETHAPPPDGIVSCFRVQGILPDDGGPGRLRTDAHAVGTVIAAARVSCSAGGGMSDRRMTPSMAHRCWTR